MSKQCVREDGTVMERTKPGAWVLVPSLHKQDQTTAPGYPVSPSVKLKGRAGEAYESPGFCDSMTYNTIILFKSNTTLALDNPQYFEFVIKYLLLEGRQKSRPALWWGVA